jgi:AraC family transcriptional regulator of adaptative response/methylated-DNA-[protein]-cysteine methyltransferase
MREKDELNYRRIEKAIEHIRTNFREQPDLDELAAHVHLSPFHFQRLFTEWAGISPKKFLQYTSIDYARMLLKENRSTLQEAAWETGLSGPGRLHDLFINIEGMTPAEYRDGGKQLTVNFSFHPSPFGKIIIASTHKGICHIAFIQSENAAFAELEGKFPAARFIQQSDHLQIPALNFFRMDWTSMEKVKLHLKGTAFQLKVWEALLKIPAGQLRAYGHIAQQLNNPGAGRAVGTAIGSNPVAYLIPCHRVIRQSGDTGNYMWGEARKAAIIGWEMCRHREQSQT